jgi:alpha-tubulin suppressor-like RCC1 family protein
VGVVGLNGGVVAISAGQYHTCAVIAGGGVKCWGDNTYGELGDGTTTNSATPVDVVGLTNPAVTVAVGQYFTCALTELGGVQCWGDNSSGQLGDGMNTERHSPGEVSGLTMGVGAITASANHVCALLEWGSVECWGENSAGPLGDGTFTNRNAPVPVVGLSEGVQAVSTGYGHTCALTGEGGVKCWGWNPFGELGNGTFTSSNTPVEVVGLSGGASSITTGYNHTCAILTTGMAKCWGANDNYKLGDYSLTSRNTPVNVYWFIY